MTAPEENIYKIRFISGGRETAVSFLHGKSVLCHVLDFLEENDIEAYLSLHKSEPAKEDENPFSISKTNEENCYQKTLSNDLRTNKENAATKNCMVLGTSKASEDDLKSETGKPLLCISWNRGAVVITIWIVCLSTVLKLGNAQSCIESLTTLKSVPSCPENDAKWKGAAVRKRCSEVKQSCCSPKDFEYHCLVNAFRNETVEVCAPRRKINYCVEFNSLGALIQSNFQMNCTNSTIHCGKFYNSTDMYKVPQCILVSGKEVNATHSKTANTFSFLSSITTRTTLNPTTTSSVLTERPNISKKTEQADAVWIYVLNVILGLLGTVLAIIVAYKLTQKCRLSKRTNKGIARFRREEEKKMVQEHRGLEELMVSYEGM